MLKFLVILKILQTPNNDSELEDFDKQMWKLYSIDTRGLKC